MNVFVLCTGRCGSTTFFKACKHITNYTVGHESRSSMVGEEHLKYPPNHIEIDNRLSWFLGRLEKEFGDSAFYVHLKRNAADTAQSFINRYDRGIIRAYRSAILMKCSPDNSPLSVCLDYCDTVNSNIEAFLKNKSEKMRFSLENAKQDFVVFWNLIAAENNLSAALSEWDKIYNASD